MANSILTDYFSSYLYRFLKSAPITLRDLKIYKFRHLLQKLFKNMMNEVARFPYQAHIATQFEFVMHF